MAPKKRGRAVRAANTPKQGGRKRATPIRAHDSDEDACSAQDGDGPFNRQPTIGVAYMLFRALFVAGVAVSFATSNGNVTQILATAAAAGAV